MENQYHELKIEAGSEGEEYFVNMIMPMCEDEVNRLLGITFGLSFNVYRITHDDYLRIRDYVKEKRGAN